MDAGELMRTIKDAAKARLDSGPDAAAGLPDGARLLDSWQSKRDGAVLFWIDEELDPNGWGQAMLHHERFELGENGWQPAGGGGHSCETAEQLIDRLGCGLHRLGGGYRDPVRVTFAIASREVSMIALRSAARRSARPPGLTGSACSVSRLAIRSCTPARLTKAGAPLAAKRCSSDGRSNHSDVAVGGSCNVASRWRSHDRGVSPTRSRLLSRRDRE